MALINSRISGQVNMSLQSKSKETKASTRHRAAIWWISKLASGMIYRRCS